jgi:hypothetical protein
MSEDSLRRALDAMVEQHDGLTKAMRLALDGRQLPRETRSKYALAAEVEALVMQVEETRRACETMEDVLADLTIILKGPPPPHIVWSWHDLPKIVRSLKEKHEASKNSRP